MRKAVKPHLSYEVEVEVAGTKHTGKYTVQGGLVHVWSRYGAKITQIGTMPPNVLATALLREIVGTYRARLH